MQKQYFVYLTTNLINQKKYIGYHYGTENDAYLGSGVILNHAIKKYGRSNFYKQVIQYYPDEYSCKEGEKYWIEYYNAVSSSEFYNLLEGGEGNMKFARQWLLDHPDKQQEFREKAWIKAADWRDKHPEQVYQNMQKAIKASKEWYNEHPEQRLKNYQKLQEWNLTHPEERYQINIQNAAKANEWYKQHPEARQKWHEAAMAGYKKWREEHPDEYQQKLEKIIQTQGMKIRCITTGLEFQSQGEAARFYGMSSTSHLSACLNGKRKHAGKLPDGTKLAWEKIENNS